MAKFGPNLLTSDGDAWSRQRKIVASTINERISKTVWSESLRHTDSLIDDLHTTETGRTETNRMFDYMKKLTILVLANAGMGASSTWHDDEHAREGFKTTFVDCITSVLNGITGPLILPRWFLKNYPSFLPGQAFLEKLSYAIDEFHRHILYLLSQERNRVHTSHGATRSNILSQLVKALDQQSETPAKSPSIATAVSAKSPLSHEEVMGNLFVFSAAGFDTTSNTLCFALVLLARYPSYQVWLQEQIDAVLPASAASSSSPATEDLDYAAVYPRLTRIHAVMHETLRLYTPLVHIAKQTRVAQTLVSPSTGKTYAIPAHANVYVNTIGLHLDPTVWRNANLDGDAREAPSHEDECVFRPSRWIVGKTEATGAEGRTGPEQETLMQPPRGYFLPWSGGPRVCPGQKMSQVEFAAIFLRLFHKHRIEAVPLKVAGSGGGNEGAEEWETREQVERRLDAQLEDAFPVLTLQMDKVFDVGDDESKGLKLRLVMRESH